MDEYVSQKAFAEKVGRSAVWINRLVKQGKLPSNEKGKIPLKAGLVAFEAAKVPGYDGNRAWGEQQRKAGKAKKAAKKAVKQPQEVLVDLPDDPESILGDMDVNNLTIAEINEQFNRAKLAEKTYQARLKELEYKEASGQLIPIGDVEADAASTGAEVRERLLSIAPRIAGVCEGKTAREIERIVEDAVNEALEGLQRARFGG